MFCRNCGKEVADGANFCRECGSPTQQTYPSNCNQAQNAIYAAQKSNNTRIVVIAVAVAAVLIIMSIVFAVALFLGSSSSISGKYEYDTGRYYYTVEFKSNGTCIFTDDTYGYTHSRSGTYEYADGEYIMEFKIDDAYLPTTYSATIRGKTLYVQQIAGMGPLESGEFEKIL